MMNNDSRFFTGYTWVSETEDCKTGLHLPTTDEAVAARMFLKPRLRYWNKGRVFIVWTMANAESVARRHEIVY